MQIISQAVRGIYMTMNGLQNKLAWNLCLFEQVSMASRNNSIQAYLVNKCYYISQNSLMLLCILIVRKEQFEIC